MTGGPRPRVSLERPVSLDRQAKPEFETLLSLVTRHSSRSVVTSATAAKPVFEIMCVMHSARSSTRRFTLSGRARTLPGGRRASEGFRARAAAFAGLEFC